jgi:hypothetical protein
MMQKERPCRNFAECGNYFIPPTPPQSRSLLKNPSRA